MGKDTYLILEENVSLSQSKIWKWQKDYYTESGINAWRYDVPHYITSNPFIAHSYAEIALEFVQEWIDKNPEAIQQTFYLLELGAGHSIFSYYFLKSFLAFRESWPSGFQFCYVITDMSQKNLDFAFSHPQLQTYIEQGVLDFALFDVEKRDPITLKIQRKNLNPETIKTPLFVITNYVLDSIKKDAFYVDERFRLNSSLISIKSKEANLQDGKPSNLNELIIDFFHAPVGSQHYPNEEFNQLLAEYSQEFRNRSFLLPTEAFHLIDYLIELSGNRLLLLSSDKGHLDTGEFSRESKPHIAFHGNCFSMMANFDALQCFFKLKGGDAFMPFNHPGLRTCAYLSGRSFLNFPRTKLVLDRNLNRLSPQDYFNFNKLIAHNAENLDLEIFATVLKLSGYDPVLFHRLLPTIKRNILTESSQVSSFARIAHAVAEQFYFIPGVSDTYFEVGLFFHTIKEYGIALNYYQKAELFFKDSFNTLYNAGLCCYHLHDFENAEIYFLRAFELNPNSKEARDWLKTSRKKIRLMPS